ncbi:MAG: sulfotransferase [Patescibacteria group bacterium]|nr:sulfotransferase [Patescibacteria group bacterium]
MARTGTTLMHSLLDGHPQIVNYPVETGFMGGLFPQLKDSKNGKKEIISLMLGIIKKRDPAYLKLLNFTFEDLEQKFYESTENTKNNSNFFDLYYIFVKSFYDLYNPSLFVKAHYLMDHSPFSHLFAEDIFNFFSDAKFIHMLRDPKDNFASTATKLILQKRPRRQIEQELWRFRIWSAQSFYCARINQKKFGSSRYKIIRYEDLCSQPEKIIPELCDFLEIDETKNLYCPTRLNSLDAGNNLEGKKFEGISNKNIGKWKERIPVHCAKVMECQPRESLEEFGYQFYFNEWQKKIALVIHKMLIFYFSKAYLRADKSILAGLDRQLLKKMAPGMPGVNWKKDTT